MTRARTAAVVPAPPWLLLPLVCAFALALRWVAWDQSLFMMNDGPDFLWQAGLLLEGDWRTALGHPYHPLYGAATALASRLTGGDLVNGAVAVSLLSGIALVVASWALARRVFHSVPWAAPAAAFVAAVHPHALKLSANVQSDGLFLALFAGALWALLAAYERGGCGRRLLLAGVLVALAYLTRPEGLFLVAPLLLWAAAGRLRGRSTTPLPPRGAALFAAGLVLVAAPYLWAIHDVSGHWGLSMKPSATAFGLTDVPEHPTWTNDSPLFSPGVPRVKTPDDDADLAEDGPGGPPAPTGASTATVHLRKGGLLPEAWERWLDGRVLGSAALEIVGSLRLETLLLLVPGVLLLRRRRPGMFTVWALLTAGWVAMCVWHVGQRGYLSHRHVMPLLVMALPACGAGWVALCATRNRALAAFTLLLLFSLAGAGVRDYDADNGPRMDALRWVTANTPADSAVAVPRRRDGWYSHRRVLRLRLPVRDDDLLAAMATHRAACAVLDLDEVERHAPHWLDGSLLRELARFDDPDGEGDTVVVLAPAGG